MSLDEEKQKTIDVIGIENDSGRVILTILDDWDWTNQEAHLLALQGKINAYFEYIGEKQYLETYPNAAGREFTIHIIARFPPPKIQYDLIKQAQIIASELDVEVRSSVYLEY